MMWLIGKEAPSFWSLWLTEYNNGFILNLASWQNANKPEKNEVKQEKKSARRGFPNKVATYEYCLDKVTKTAISCGKIYK